VSRSVRRRVNRFTNRVTATFVFTLAAALALVAAPPSTAGEAAPSALGRVSVSEIRVNETVNPLGIDDADPALSWRLDGSRNGASQSAYEIEVATSRAGLLAGEADVWATNKVPSTQSAAVHYNGPQPESGQRYHWRVRVWDQADRVTDWSRPGWWEMGLLEPADWEGAGWISPATGVDFDFDDFILETDFTIRSAAGGVVFRADGERSYYLWQVNATTDKVLLRPHYRVNGEWVAIRSVDISAVVPKSAAFDEHHLKIEAIGDSIRTWIDGTLVDTTTTQHLASGAFGFRAGDSAENAAFTNVTLRSPDGEVIYASDWADNADPSFPDATFEDGSLVVAGNDLQVIAGEQPESPLLRREFHLDKEVVSARAYGYGLGWYELSLNGHKVDDRVLTPAATSFSNRNLYQTYDVTDQVHKGDNAAGVWLADGYGKGYSQFGWRWTGPRQAIVAIDVLHPDGTTTRIGTDEDWRWAPSPVTRADIYNGEDFDARLVQDGWDEVGHDASDWKPVETVPAPSSRLLPDEAPPIRVNQTLEPVKMYEPEPDVFVFDLGQNIAGWTRLRVEGDAGTEVTLRHSENIHEDGSLDPWTNRRAEATDRYTLAGTFGGETWEPRFTYHGFRYVEVTGLTEPPEVEGRSIHADLDVIGSFESSDPMLDQIYENNRWTILNNFMSFPTDTPVRDERTPPAMDVQAHQDASIRDLNMATYFRKYLDDIRSSRGGDSTMNGVQIPLAWELYQEYGDKRVLTELYPDIKGRADWLLTHYPDGTWPLTEGSHADGRFGDWCAPLPADQVNGGLGDKSVGNCFSEPNVVSSALQYRQVDVASKIAAELGHSTDAQRYRDAAEAVKATFNERFLNSDGSYDSGRQTTSILPLVFGMVPEDKLELVTDYFIDRVVEANDGHLDTGIFGTRYIVDALADAGRADVALRMLQKTTYPSFGYQIVEHGATTAWEGWPLQSSMHTHDHAMFVGINASYLTRFAGIRSTAPGYETLEIRPMAPAGLERARGSIETVRGQVTSSWHDNGSTFTLDVEVPVGSGGEVFVPNPTGEAVRATRGPGGAEFLREEDGFSVYSVGSGTFRFVVGQGRPGSPAVG
jgi:hypothetical protein